MKYPEDYINQIIQGDALTILKQLPNEIVNCCVTSPPYWSLRDYQVEGQLGLEKTFEEYITKLCDIFDQVKRVLRKDGTCWVNLGDSYNGSKSGNTNGVYADRIDKSKSYANSDSFKKEEQNIPTKSLCLIPQRFAIEMVNRGWILRNTIIWHKPNCMPSSANDRFTVDFEYLFFFVKSSDTQFWTNEKTGLCVGKQPLGTKGIEGIDWEWQKKDSSWQRPSRDETFKLPSRQKSTYAKEGYKKVSFWTGHDYWFEQQFEAWKDTNINDTKRAGQYIQYGGKHKDSKDNKGVVVGNPTQGRNKRCVWTIPTQPFPEAHFATFPEALIETPIKAGCPQYVCKKCGKGREKIYEVSYESPNTRPGNPNINRDRYIDKTTMIGYRPNKVFSKINKELGYSDCLCNASWESGICLDPFMGAGTTAVVAKKQGKKYIGIELKQEYIDMANKRLRKISERLF